MFFRARLECANFFAHVREFTHNYLKTPALCLTHDDKKLARIDNALKL